MQIDKRRQRIGYRGGSFRWRAQGLFFKVLAVAAGAVLLLGAVAISVVLFAEQRCRVVLSCVASVAVLMAAGIPP